MQIDITKEYDALAKTKKTKSGKNHYKCIYFKKDASEIDTNGFNAITELQNIGINAKLLAVVLFNKYLESIKK